MAQYLQVAEQFSLEVEVDRSHCPRDMLYSLNGWNVHPIKDGFPIDTMPRGEGNVVNVHLALSPLKLPTSHVVNLPSVAYHFRTPATNTRSFGDRSNTSSGV